MFSQILHNIDIENFLTLLSVIYLLKNLIVHNFVLFYIPVSFIIYFYTSLTHHIFFVGGENVTTNVTYTNLSFYSF